MSYLCSPPKRDASGIQFKLDNESNVIDTSNQAILTPLKRPCKISCPNTSRSTLSESTQRELYSFIKDKNEKKQDTQNDNVKKTSQRSLDSSRTQSQTDIHYAQLLHKQQQYQQNQIQQLQQSYSKSSLELPEIYQSQRDQKSNRVLMVKYHDSSLNIQPEFMKNQGSMCSADLWSQRQSKLFFSLHSDYYEDLKLLSLQQEQKKHTSSSVFQGNPSHQTGKNMVGSGSLQNLKDPVQQNSQFLFGKARLRSSKSQEQIQIPGSSSSPSQLPSLGSNNSGRGNQKQQTDEKLVDSGKFLMMEIDRDGASNFKPEKMKKQAKLILRLQSEKQGIFLPSQNPRQYIDSIIRKGLPLDLLYPNKKKSEPQLSLSPLKQANKKQFQSITKFSKQNTDSTFCTDNNLRSRIISASCVNGSSTITSLPLEATPNSERRVKQLFTKLEQHNPSGSAQSSLTQIPKLSPQISGGKIASKEENTHGKKEEGIVISTKRQKLKGQLFPVSFNINDHKIKEFSDSESPLLKSYAKKKKQFSIEKLRLGEQVTNIISQCNETLNSAVHTIKEVEDILVEKEQLDTNLINEKEDLNSSFS